MSSAIWILILNVYFDLEKLLLDWNSIKLINNLVRPLVYDERAVATPVNTYYMNPLT